jgi:hypothetical protein
MAEQTPADWLIEHWASGDAYAARNGGHKRPLFQIRDDHNLDDCPPGAHCANWSGEASWPTPITRDDLAGGWTKWSRNPDYVLMMGAPI